MPQNTLFRVVENSKNKRLFALSNVLPNEYSEYSHSCRFKCLEQLPS